MNKNKTDGEMLKIQNEAMRRTNKTLKQYRTYGMVGLVITGGLILAAAVSYLGFFDELAPELTKAYAGLLVGALGCGVAAIYYLVYLPRELNEAMTDIKKINPADPKTYIDDPELVEMMEEDDDDDDWDDDDDD
jgi:hypothetical protein